MFREPAPLSRTFVAEQSSVGYLVPVVWGPNALDCLEFSEEGQAVFQGLRVPRFWLRASDSRAAIGPYRLLRFQRSREKESTGE